MKLCSDLALGLKERITLGSSELSGEVNIMSASSAPQRDKAGGGGGGGGGREGGGRGKGVEKEARSDGLIRRAHRENALLPYCLFVSTTDTTRSAMIPHDLLTATQPVSQPPLSQEESAAGVWTL